MINSLQTIAVIEKIFLFYESWATRLELSCHKGCAACCTRNVTMTQAEGELILQGLLRESRLEWLIETLQIKGRIGRPGTTTNEWAKRCLQGQETTDMEPDPVLDPCPFLDRKQSCSIYQLRPFSCRCFGSTVDCATSGMAEQPDILMEINTVTLQLIEHLGQGKNWGNMLDVLPTLIRQNKSSRKNTEEQLQQETVKYMRQARGMPGLLVMPAHQAAVQVYLADLFSIRLGRTTLGEIMNIPL